MPERVESELDVLSELVQKTSQDIRTLLFELRPLGLETQGLLSTLQQYVSRFPATRPAQCGYGGGTTEHPAPAGRDRGRDLHHRAGIGQQRAQARARA